MAGSKQSRSIPIWLLGAASGALGAILALRYLVPKPGLPLPRDANGAGVAFITGASSGIGAEFARALGARGYDLLITARRAAKLEELAEEVRTNFGVNVEVVAADLSKIDDMRRLEGRIREMPNLTLLINNAGFGTKGNLAETTLDKQVAMVNVHVMATMRLTHAALPGMTARNRGGIINVSSIAGFMSSPTSANYCATKAYINYFSESVSKEVAPHGISIQSLCPGYTYSEFHDTPEYDEFERSNMPDFLWMTSREVVDESLDALGNGDPIFIPRTVNRLLVLATRSRTARMLMGVIRRRGGLKLRK